MANQISVNTGTGNQQVTVTSTGNIQVTTSRAVIGTVANVLSANFANFAGNVTVANQPNITGLGTLGNLSVSNTITTLNLSVTGNLSAGNLIANSANYANFANVSNIANSVAVGNVVGIGNIATINLDGSSSNVLFGNGVFAPESTSIANANYANFAGEAFSVSGSNVNGAVNLANFATTANAVAGANVSGIVANANFASYSEQANNANLATFATTANAVAGANVSGEVANANYSSYANIAASANNVAVGNVVGIGNIATINLDGSSSNVLFGNGVFAPESTSIANANYANFAGTAFSVSGSNVSGEVANANYASFANIASTANSVAGANISGEVANANYSSYSNIASTANSVAVGNVSGIGNIATTNYDGNASNILYGNGGFFALPIISNVANANYANFAGEAFNVNASNITGTVANANYSAYAGEANTANLATFATTANAVAGANVSGEVANANYASFANLASTANLATFATTANAVAGANVSGEVANANYASFANVASIANSVAGANVSGEVANANYSSYANIASSANSVALANVVGIGNIANINLDGSSSNVLFGNGVFAPESTSIANANYANFAGTAYSVAGANVSGEVANANYATFAGTAYSVSGANVSGEVANANYASYAGNVTINAQANITSLGNLVSLTINNGNVVLPTKQFDPNGITVGSNANILLMANSNFVDVDYGNGQGGGNLRFGKTASYVKARGNSTTIASAAANDVVGRTNYMYYNGTSNVLAVSTQVNLTTLNSNANAITSGGNYQVITANPNGDQGNANALSNQNLYVFENSGRLSITTGAATGTGSYLALTGYGITAGGNGAQSQGVNFIRYRGNRDANLSVQPGDQLGAFSFLGYNGASLFTTRTASLQGIVDSTYVANATAIPTAFKLTSTSSSAQNDFWLYSNGNARFGLVGGGNTTFVSNSTVFVNNLDATSNANVTGNLNVTANANVTGNLNVTANAIITGDISAANVIVNTSGFMKLASYTVTALNAITGQIGWMAAVSDSASGGNPNGMIAFWDTTNSRWSYIHDNSAV